MTPSAASPPPASMSSPIAASSTNGLSLSSLGPPSGPARAPSAGSHYEAQDGRDARADMYGNGFNSAEQHDYRQPQHRPYDDGAAQQRAYQHPSYLPPMTTSPPPHAPTYIPPPQHAMPPDPIHGLMPGPSYAGNAPYPTHYRSGQGPAPYSSGFRLPNGHTSGPEGFHPPRQPLSMGPGGPMPTQALLQQAIMMSNGSGRPGSASESRDRRPRERSHHRDDDGDRDSREEEVISTIFVVGFPDDMSEREFQNIFTFAPGFEAATLKFPSGSQRSREPTATLLAELTHLAASQQAAAAQHAAANGEIPEVPLQSPLEEALAALQLSSTTSSSTTPSAAISLTPSAPSGPFNQGLPQLPTRRQTIGFARFKSRADALAARESLQGKKIDPLTGATLKAEMAKKNLHTKRNNANDDLVGMLLKSGRLAGLVGHSSYPNQPPPPMMNGIGPPGSVAAGGVAGGPGPAAYAPVRDNWDWHNPDEKYNQHHPAPAHHPSVIAPTTSTSTSTRQPATAPPFPQPTNDASNSNLSNQSSSSASPPQSVTSANGHANSKALLLAAEAEDADEWSAIDGMTMSIEGLASRHGEDALSSSNATMRHERERSGMSGASYPMSGSTGGVQTGSNSAATATAAATAISIPTSVQATAVDANTQPLGDHPAASSLSPSSSSAPLNNVHSPTMTNNNPNNPYRPSYSHSTATTSPRASAEAYGGSPTGMSGEHMERGRIVGGGGGGNNPADQNPPINTLYVGNLPANSPVTHPPHFLEEQLRELFMQCPGFKRMSFRQKLNGPMCFVEFEDVNYASQAMNNLYGHNLNGLVKGGIRLSYSKNSLGQRGNSHPAGISPITFGGIAHTVALAGMSSPSSVMNAYQNGLTHGNHGNGTYAGPNGYTSPHSAPIPMPNHLRRGSEVSGLSPTAQPFNASLPAATSPRSRFFGSSPNKPDGSYPGHPTISTAQPIPQPGGPHQQYQQGQQGPQQSGSGSFSPVSSPIRTPASYSWVSSGSTGIAQVGNGGYGFEPFSPNNNGGGMSLSGAASAWQQGNNSGTPM